MKEGYIDEPTPEQFLTPEEFVEGMQTPELPPEGEVFDLLTTELALAEATAEDES